MSDTIITVENLSKRYKLGVIGATSLRESVERGWHRLRGRDWRHHMGEVGAANQTADRRQQTTDSMGKTAGRRLQTTDLLGGGASDEVDAKQSGIEDPEKGLQSAVCSLQSPRDDLWALKDVSFEVKRGEVLGVIGRNGAGKSTLLKILTRITEPTSGRAIMRGRVASLLEVGTGFHPELTGRENVYLNGAILGMKRAEITQKFDEIVAFAEVEKFIDTPVKRYSSGMYVRLAFAVAAHLEPEILLVDEVLAVGDFEFQKRCLGKMSDVARGGKTVLFVSHNMNAVSSLCQNGILLNMGYLAYVGKVYAAIENYLISGAYARAGLFEWDISSAPGDSHLRLIRVALSQSDSCASKNIKMENDFVIEITLHVLNSLSDVNISIQVTRSDGIVVLHTANLADKGTIARTCGIVKLSCTVPAHLLNSGTYYISVGADIPHVRVLFHEQRFACMTIESSSSAEMARYPSSAWQGVVSPLAVRWERNSYPFAAVQNRQV